MYIMHFNEYLFYLHFICEIKLFDLNKLVYFYLSKCLNFANEQFTELSL